MADESLYRLIHFFADAYIEYNTVEYRMNMIDDLLDGIPEENCPAHREMLINMFALVNMTKMMISQIEELEWQGMPESQNRAKELRTHTFRQTMLMMQDAAKFRKELDNLVREREDYRMAAEQLDRTTIWQKPNDIMNPAED